MIRSWRGREAKAIFERVGSRRLPSDVQRAALRKLLMLDAAAALGDLRVPPSNRLEALKGDRRGQLSIRINDRWRVCFRWIADAAEDVEVVDYH